LMKLPGRFDETVKQIKDLYLRATLDNL
jgi:hypothetical protein